MFGLAVRADELARYLPAPGAEHRALLEPDRRLLIRAQVVHLHLPERVNPRAPDDDVVHARRGGADVVHVALLRERDARSAFGPDVHPVAHELGLRRGRQVVRPLRGLAMARAHGGVVGHLLRDVRAGAVRQLELPRLAEQGVERFFRALVARVRADGERADVRQAHVLVLLVRRGIQKRGVLQNLGHLLQHRGGLHDEHGHGQLGHNVSADQIFELAPERFAFRGVLAAGPGARAIVLGLQISGILHAGDAAGSGGTGVGVGQRAADREILGTGTASRVNRLPRRWVLESARGGTHKSRPSPTDLASPVARRLNHPFCSGTSSSSDIVVARAHKSPTRSAAVRSQSRQPSTPQIAQIGIA